MIVPTYIYYVTLTDLKKPGSPDFLKQFQTEREARDALREVAKRYVVKLEGELHADKIYQDGRDERDIRKDEKLRLGLYLQTRDKLVYLLEKKVGETEGVLGTDYCKVTKPLIYETGYFAVTAVPLDLSQIRETHPNAGKEEDGTESSSSSSSSDSSDSSSDGEVEE